MMDPATKHGTESLVARRPDLEIGVVRNTRVNHYLRRSPEPFDDRNIDEDMTVRHGEDVATFSQELSRNAETGEARAVRTMIGEGEREGERERRR